jgi:hypothetical protein
MSLCFSPHSNAQCSRNRINSIEPMLQSIPDPFDSYGPPQAEDQIFSILAPLSIMTTSTVASTNGSPLPTPVPELEGLPAVSNSHLWMTPSPGTVAFPTAPSEWEDDKPPSSSPPPRSISPPNRKHLAPLNAARHPRKSESSKLRSVLSPIDEARSRQASEDGRAASIMNTLTPSPPPTETSPHHSWSFVYDNAQQDDSSEDRDGKTPTHSYFPRSSTPPRPPLQDPGADSSHPEMQVPIAT